MRLHRLLTVASFGVLFGVLLVACTTANPGWTYQPAPSITPPPSIEASESPSASPASGAVVISAVGVAFEQAEVNVPADEPFQIEFANNDTGTPHNVVIRRDNPDGEEVFTGETFNGVETRIYEVPALEAGAYAFICTVHPTTMVGTMTAE